MQNCFKSPEKGLNQCFLCYKNFFNREMNETLKFKPSYFDQEECILKLSEKNHRKILILNQPLKDYAGFDQKYEKFANALENEYRIALQ